MVPFFPKFKNCCFLHPGVDSKCQKANHDIALSSPPIPAPSSKEPWKDTQESFSLVSWLYFLSQIRLHHESQKEGKKMSPTPYSEQGTTSKRT